MNGVYLWMAAGVAITGVVAWGISEPPGDSCKWCGAAGSAWLLSIGTFIGAIALQRARRLA